MRPEKQVARPSAASCCSQGIVAAARQAFVTKDYRRGAAAKPLILAAGKPRGQRPAYRYSHAYNSMAAPAPKQCAGLLGRDGVNYTPMRGDTPTPSHRACAHPLSYAVNANRTKLSCSPAARLLRDPAALAPRSARVKVIETHISWVFLTSKFAYKLKKPVRFEFVDFSTPGKRRAACFEELRLNRRLACGVYLDVLPLTAEVDGRLALGGAGKPVDYVLKMRRLAAEDALDEAIRLRRLKDGEVQRVAKLLVGFLLYATTGVGIA